MMRRLVLGFVVCCAITEVAADAKVRLFLTGSNEPAGLHRPVVRRLKPATGWPWTKATD